MSSFSSYSSVLFILAAKAAQHLKVNEMSLKSMYKTVNTKNLEVEGADMR